MTIQYLFICNIFIWSIFKITDEDFIRSAANTYVQMEKKLIQHQKEVEGILSIKKIPNTV